MKILKADFSSPRQITLKEEEIEEPKEDEVLVKVKACGICGSNVSAFQAGEGGNPGHEIAGIVEKIGEGVKLMKVKDRVNTDFISGGFAEYVKAPEDIWFPIPDELSFEEGALLTDTVGTPLVIVKNSLVSEGNKVGVWGCGPLGLSVIQICKAYGASFVLAVEPYEKRRESALKLGADVVFDPSSSELADYISEKTEGERLDVVINANPKSVRQAASFVKTDGNFGSLGGFPEKPPRPMHFRSAGYIEKELYPEIVDLVLSGKVLLKPLISHTYPLEQINEAFRMRFLQQQQSLKVVVTVDRSHLMPGQTAVARGQGNEKNL